MFSLYYIYEIYVIYVIILHDPSFSGEKTEENEVTMKSVSFY